MKKQSINICSCPALEKCLFGAVNLAKHIDVDLYKYCGYGIGFDKKGFFSIDDEVGGNVIIFGADVSSSLHVDNKNIYILIVGKGLTQRLEHTVAAEKMYSMDFTK